MKESLALLCAAILAIASASQRSLGAQETIEVRTWDLPPAEDKLRRPAWNHFIRTHPHIRFVMTRGIEVETATSTSALLMAMAGNTAPDFLYLALERLPTFMEQRFLYPLAGLVRPEQRAWLDRWILPQMREALGNGRTDELYAVPYFYTTDCLWYRRDLFLKAGLDPDRPPETWQQLYECARQLSLPEQGVWGFDLRGGHNAGYAFIEYVWSAGGQMVRKRGPDQIERCSFNEPPGVRALNFYKKLRWSRWSRCPDCSGTFDVESVEIETGRFIAHDTPRCPKCGRAFSAAVLERDKKVYTGVVMHSPATNPVEELKQGRLAMTVGSMVGELMLPLELDPALIGIAAFPAGPGGSPVYKLNAGCFAINAQLRDPRRIRAAWEVVAYQASREALQIRVETLVREGLADHVNPFYLEQCGFAEYARRAPRQWRKVGEEISARGRVMPISQGFMNVISTELPLPIQKVLYARPGDIRRLDVRVLLDQAAAQSDTNILGARDPAVHARRRNIALAVLIALVAILGFFFVRAIRLIIVRHGLEGPSPESKGRARRFVHLAAWCFMLPALLSIFLWRYYPLLMGSTIAFQDYKILGGSRFVWLDNFVEVLWNERFWHSLWITFYYVGLNLVLVFPAPIVMGLLLAEVPRGKYLFRTLVYLPAMVSGTVLLFLWKRFYDPSPSGFLNTLLSHLGIGPMGWLADPRLAMLCVVLPVAWATAGPGSLIYLAAMKSIPDELYEAADVDGAGFFAKIFHITLPHLKPLLIIQLVGTFVGTFHSMGNILPLTGGGPEFATNVIGMEIWRASFLFLRFGYAAAVAWILGAMLIGFTVYQLRILQQVEFKRAENV